MSFMNNIRLASLLEAFKPYRNTLDRLNDNEDLPPYQKSELKPHQIKRRKNAKLARKNRKKNRH